eukprot:11850001-Alexandrium_andersonii.AAC.1
MPGATPAGAISYARVLVSRAPGVSVQHPAIRPAGAKGGTGPFALLSGPFRVCPGRLLSAGLGRGGH